MTSENKRIGRVTLQELEAFSALRQAALFPDIRQMNALQMAYIGDTLHDLYVRSHLLSGG